MTRHETELETLTNTMLAMMRGHNRVVTLSALNFCMATLIAIEFDGAEGALRFSDEQTRLALSQLIRHETSHRTH